MGRSEHAKTTTLQKRKRELMSVADDSTRSDDEGGNDLVVDDRIRSKPIPAEKEQKYSWPPYNP